MSDRVDNLSFHPASAIFPLMSQEELQALANDIKVNGLLEDVVVDNDKKIVDGRNRFLACDIAHVDPRYKKLPRGISPVAYVISENLRRRQLTPSQSAMCAARAREYYDQQAKERQKLSEGRGHKKGPENLPDLKTDARDAAGKAFGVSGKTTDFATKVLEHGVPELVNAVDSGRMAVSTAAIYCTEPPEKQREIVEKRTARRNYAKSSSKLKHEKVDPPDKKPGESHGVGVKRANEAIDCLKRIPKNDGLRKRGFQIVTDWIRHNK